MIGMSFKFEARRFDRLKADAQKAIARGLNEGGDKVRTQVQKALKTQTGVKLYKSITGRVRTVRAFSPTSGPVASIGFHVKGGSVYAMVVTGKAIPIREFPVKATSRGIDAKTWGVTHLFKRSFAIKGKGVEGFRARTTDKRFPLRTLKGPNLAKEAVTPAIATVFYGSVQSAVPPAVLKHLEKTLAR